MAQGGYIYQQGASPQTESVISSRFKIFTDVVGVGKFVKLGVTSSFQISETRTVEAIRGLGYGDQVAELVPGVTEPLSITIQRTCLYLANIMQVLGYKAGVSGGVRSIRHHRWPFDIKTEIVFRQLASEDPGNAYRIRWRDPGPHRCRHPERGRVQQPRQHHSSSGSGYGVRGLLDFQLHDRLCH